MSWMKMLQNDLDSHRLSWAEAVDLTQNWPLWRLLASCGARHLQRCNFKPNVKMIVMGRQTWQGRSQRGGQCRPGRLAHCTLVIQLCQLYSQRHTHPSQCHCLLVVVYCVRVALSEVSKCPFMFVNLCHVNWYTSDLVAWMSRSGMPSMLQCLGATRVGRFQVRGAWLIRRVFTAYISWFLVWYRYFYYHANISC